MHAQAPPWTRWDHEVKGLVEGKLVPIPVNINTVNRLFNLALQSEAEMESWLAEVQVQPPTHAKTLAMPSSVGRNASAAHAALPVSASNRLLDLGCIIGTVPPGWLPECRTDGKVEGRATSFSAYFCRIHTEAVESAGRRARCTRDC